MRLLSLGTCREGFVIDRGGHHGNCPLARPGARLYEHEIGMLHARAGTLVGRSLCA